MLPPSLAIQRKHRKLRMYGCVVLGQIPLEVILIHRLGDVVRCMPLTPETGPLSSQVLDLLCRMESACKVEGVLAALLDPLLFILFASNPTALSSRVISNTGLMVQQNVLATIEEHFLGKLADGLHGTLIQPAARQERRPALGENVKRIHNLTSQLVILRPLEKFLSPTA